MPRQSGPKSNFRCKLLIINRITALSRFAEPFQNLSNHFKIVGWRAGYLLSLEGADSILSWRHLEKSRADGLIALGPVHYGPGVYGHGTDDEGPMPPVGHELLKEMERLGIILDVT